LIIENPIFEGFKLKVWGLEKWLARSKEEIRML